jgi:DNA-binding CsgD family transcriptional regulator
MPADSPQISPAAARRCRAVIDGKERQIRWSLAAIGLGAFAMLLTLEIVTETDELDLTDVLVDALSLFLTVASAVGIALLAQRMQRQHEEKLSLIRDLETARREGEGWRDKMHSHVEGIRIEMERQFEDWGMTNAEREIALLILKGLSHKEVAALRGTSEATVRQQAQSIYGKAKLPGKTAFSAYFLEDLWVPEQSIANRLEAPPRTQ